MVTAAKTVSQVLTHMSIAFGLAYWLTGSVAFGGLAAIIEPVINVMLLPLHQKAWAMAAQRASSSSVRYTALVAEKISQTGMHMGVAFAVMYWATGSIAFGGLIAVLEPICNVVVLPFHDKAWAILRERIESRNQSYAVA